jgi:hypothetical protein
MKKPITKISDNALMRYLERVKGMDLEQLRREIGRKIDLAQEHPGASGVRVDGFTYKLQDGVVKTVVSNKSRCNRKGRRKGLVRDD